MITHLNTFTKLSLAAEPLQWIPSVASPEGQQQAPGLPAPRNVSLDCVHIFGHFVQMNDKMFGCAGLAVLALSVPHIPVCSELLETRTQPGKCCPAGLEQSGLRALRMGRGEPCKHLLPTCLEGLMDQSPS